MWWFLMLLGVLLLLAWLLFGLVEWILTHILLTGLILIFIAFVLKITRDD